MSASSLVPNVILVLSDKRKATPDLGLTNLTESDKILFARSITSSEAKTTLSSLSDLWFDPTSYASFIRIFQLVHNAHGRIDTVVLDLTSSPTSQSVSSPTLVSSTNSVSGSGYASHSLTSTNSSSPVVIHASTIPADLDEISGITGSDVEKVASSAIHDLVSSKLDAEPSHDVSNVTTTHAQLQAHLGSATGPGPERPTSTSTEMDEEDAKIIKRLVQVDVPVETKLALWGVRAASWYLSRNIPKKGGKIILIAKEPFDPLASPSSSSSSSSPSPSPSPSPSSPFLHSDQNNSSLSSTRTEEDVIAASTIVGLVRALGPSCVLKKITLSLILEPIGGKSTSNISGTTTTHASCTTDALLASLADDRPPDMYTNITFYIPVPDASTGTIYTILGPEDASLGRVEGYRRCGTRLVFIIIAVGVVKAAITNIQANVGAWSVGATALVLYAWSRGLIWKPFYLVFGFVLAQVIAGRVLAAETQKENGKTRDDSGKTARVGVFLGSGGHTSEAIQLLSALDPNRYTPRTYIYSIGDSMSLSKARNFEDSYPTATRPTFIELPRARKVAQSLPSSVFTTLYSLLFAFWHLTILPLWRSRATQGLCDLLIVNGPGTCVVVVFATMFPRLFGLPSPRVIYVESFARVNSLSLSGKILQHIVDKFIVQWPEKMEPVLKAREGWLV